MASTDEGRDTGDQVYAALSTPRLSQSQSQSQPPLHAHDAAFLGGHAAQASSTQTNVLRNMAAILGLQIEATFFCQICYDEAPLSESHRLDGCGHRFCASCLQNYLVFNIQQGEIDLRCFFNDDTTLTNDKDEDTRKDEDEEDEASTVKETACLAPISDEEVRLLVDDVTWAKYQRFQFNKTNKNARQCPYCDHSQLFDGELSRDCLCEDCGRVFCFAHSNAHPGQTCAAYERRVRKVEKLNTVAINKLCKACPGCGQFVEKNGGCNQMKCSSCKTSFCWICREVIDESTFPVHYQWWNIRGCGGDQMRDVDAASPCERAIITTFRGLFFLVFGPPAILLAMVATALMCGLYPCQKKYDLSFRQAFTSCVCICGYIVIAPVVALGGLLFVPCLCVAFCSTPGSFLPTRRTTATQDDTSRSTNDLTDASPEIEIVTPSSSEKSPV